MNIDDLKKEYDIFINKYNQKDCFKSIIAYKYLPNWIRGFVNQTMMIAINPLFIKSLTRTTNSQGLVFYN
jgi:hypothetical protein